MRKEVSAAKLHQAFKGEDTPQFDKTMTAQSYPGIQMWYTEYGLEFTIRGNRTGTQVFGIIPLANVVGCTFVTPKETNNVKALNPTASGSKSAGK